MHLKGVLADVWVPAFAQIDLKNATLKLRDGTSESEGGPNELEIKIGEGNLTYGESRNIEYTPDRGVLDEVREGDEVPMEVSFDFIWDYIRGTTGTGCTPSIEDALKNRGCASDWQSSDDDACRPFALDIVILYQPTPAECGDQEEIVLSDFRWESLDHDLRAGSIACSGNCNVTEATATRTAQSV